MEISGSRLGVLPAVQIAPIVRLKQMRGAHGTQTKNAWMGLPDNGISLFILPGDRHWYSQDTIPGGDRSPSIYQPATSTQWNSQQSGFVCLELANTHGPSSVGG